MHNEHQPVDPEGGEPVLPEALQAALRQASNTGPNAPTELDERILATSIERLQQRRQNAGCGERPSPSPTPRRRSPWRRRILLAAAAVTLLGGAFWFQHWADAPISPDEGHRELVVERPALVPRFGLPLLDSVSDALAKARAADQAGRRGDAMEFYRQALHLEPDQTDVLRAQANLLIEACEWEQAEKWLATLLQLEPDDVSSRLRLADVRIRSGKLDAGLGLLDSLPENGTNAATIFALRAKAAHAKGEQEQALALWRDGVRLAPADKFVNAEFQATYRSLDRGAEIPTAYATLAAEAESAADRNRFRLSQLQTLSRMDKEPAESIVAAVLAEEPDNGDARLLQARLLTDAGELERAETILRELTARPDASRDWKFALIRLMHRLGRDQEAWQLFEQAYLAEPEGGAANAVREATGTPVMQFNDPGAPRVEQLFRRSVELHPESLDHLGSHHVAWLRDIGMTDRARERVHELLELGDGPHLRIQRAELLINQGQYTPALEDLEMALRFDPGNARAWNDQGFAQEQLERPDEAVASYKRALLLEPSYQVPANNLTRCRTNQQQVRQVVDDYTELLGRRMMGREYYLLRRSWAWLAAGRADQMLADADEGLRIAPFNLELLTAKAMALQDRGRYDDAMALANRIQQRSPDNHLASFIIGYIAVDLGDLATAELQRLKMLARGNRSDSLRLEASIALKQGRFEDSMTLRTRAATMASTPDDGVEQRAYAGLLAGDPQTAADYAWLLDYSGASNGRAKYWWIGQYLSLRLQGKNAEGEAVLAKAMTQVRACAWPDHLLRVFAGEFPPEVAIAKSRDIAFEMLKKVDLWPHKAFGYEVYTRAVLGLYAECESDWGTARTHYLWLQEHPDRFLPEYGFFATNRLAALQDKPATGRRLPSINDPPAGQTPDLNRGLLAWLPLVDDLRDHSSAAQPVTVRGSVTISDGAARFPGDGNFLELPHLPLRRREFSVSMWVRTAGTNATFSLFSQKESDHCGKAIYLQLRNHAQLYMGFWANDVTAPTTIPDREQWNHLVFQYRGWRQQIWLNGRLLVERVAEPLDAAAGGARVGGQPPNWQGHHDLDGWMRDFRVYDRALQQTEVHQLAGVRPESPTSNQTLAAGGNLTEGGVPPGRANPTPLATTTLVDPRPFLQIEGNHLVISGPPIQVYQLQATPSLNSAWMQLATLTNLTGSVSYVDEEALEEGLRFYRVEVTQGPGP